MKFIFCLLTIIFFSSCNKKYILVPNIKGKIYSEKNNKPIRGVQIFVSKYAINNTGIVKTNFHGSFFYNGFFTNSHADMRSMSSLVQTVFILKHNNSYKSIDIKKYYKKIDYAKRDTIDLGIIYFESLKNIDKDSIPE